MSFTGFVMFSRALICLSYFPSLLFELSGIIRVYMALP
jgi:hypothetical protein